jgi:hypothetical protein
MSDPNLSSFIWSVADLLRGDYTAVGRARLLESPERATEECSDE